MDARKREIARIGKERERESEREIARVRERERERERERKWEREGKTTDLQHHAICSTIYCSTI
jgi:hypothetical protein